MQSLNESMHTRDDTRVCSEKEKKLSGSLYLAEVNQSVSEPAMGVFHNMQWKRDLTSTESYKTIANKQHIRIKPD